MIKINWLDIEIEGKVYRRILFFGVAIIIIYMFINFVSLAIPRVYHMNKNTVIDTENTVKNGLIDLHRGQFRLKISHWAYKEGQAVETFNSSFILKNKESEKMYLLKTQMDLIEDKHFIDGLDCLKCGLTTESIVLGLPNGVYDLYILYQNDGDDLLANTGVQVNL